MRLLEAGAQMLGVPMPKDKDAPEENERFLRFLASQISAANKDVGDK